MRQYHVSIITPCYNNPLQVGRLLESIYKNLSEKKRLFTYEVIVVDDGSDDDSIKEAAGPFKGIAYIKLEKNSGPARARNVGAKHAKGELLLFLDSDVELENDTLDKVETKFQDDRINILTGEYSLEPVKGGFFPRYKALVARSWVPNMDTITVFVARIGLIKKGIFEELGGFDESIRTASSEEWEFGYRLMKKGYKIYYDPSITVRHHFPNFIKQPRLFYHRTKLWMLLFLQKKSFDNSCTTPLQAMTTLCNVLLPILFLAGLFNKTFSVFLLFTIIAYAIGNVRFFRLVLQNEGWIFLMKAIPVNILLSYCVVAGAIAGLLQHFLKGFKR